MKEKGIVHLILVLVIVIVAAVAVFLLQNSGKYSIPGLQNKQSTADKRSVSLKNDYQNPFDKNTQYINPFAVYKNPFDSVK